MSVNLKGKRGRISKTVQVKTNDPSRPLTVLTVSMNVRDVIHMKKYLPREIFSGSCSGCHIDRGAGKRGAELFSYDCLMCHGQNRSAEAVPEMRKKPKDELRNAIRNGVSNTAMPGWHVKRGGPLGDEEIESLVEFLSP